MLHIQLFFEHILIWYSKYLKNYIFCGIVSRMKKFSCFFPWKRLPPNPKRSFFIQSFVQSVEYGFVVNMNCIFQKHFSLLLFLLIFIIFLKVQCLQKGLLKLLKKTDIHYENSLLGFFLWGFFIIYVHIF
jgi:hypothetical protein